MKNLLRNRNWMLFWLSNVMQEMGNILFQVSGMATVYTSSGSVLQTVGVLAAGTLPSFILSPFAGAIVDRYPRKMVMLCMNICRVLLLGTLLLLMSGDEVAVWVIYAVTFVLSAATAFYSPARQSMIPTLVGKSQLIHANSFNMAVFPLSGAAGYLIGGSLFEQLSLSILIMMIVGCYVAALFFISLVRERRIEQSKESKAYAKNKDDLSLIQSMREGITYVRHHKISRVLVTMEIIEHVPHGIWTSALMIVFAIEALGGGTAEWGQINGSFFISMLVGTLIAMVIERVIARHPGWMIIGNALLNCVMTVIYALSVSPLFAIALAFLFGIPFALRDVAQDSLLQATVDEDVLGRVYAFRDMGRNTMFMVGSLFFGWMAEFIDIRTIYIIGGILYAFTSLYALSSRALRHSQINTASNLM